MKTLLVLTAGQTDVQLVVSGTRQEIRKESCAALHDEIERRAGHWRLVDSPPLKVGPAAESLPAEDFELCTPKLDAVVSHLKDEGVGLTAALVLETRRNAQVERGDPRFAGEILATRLQERGTTEVHRVAFLADRERLEDRSQPRDALIRREVVDRIDQAVRERLSTPDLGQIVVATTGGMPVVSNLVEEIVRLHAAAGVVVDLFEVADGAKADPPMNDRAVLRRWTPEPVASYQARRHALELIAKGNLLGAWGAVQHLHDDDVERRWTCVIEWLACFAASMPMAKDCNLATLTHPRMAVRAALRVELALRAGDVPRAVHGTVAFFEAALWDGLNERVERAADPNRRRYFRMKSGAGPSGDKLLRQGDGSDEDRKRPFELKDTINGVAWYWIYDGDGGPAARLARRFIDRDGLVAFDRALGSDIRELRNDVAHNEPTAELMEDARRRMVKASLWSTGGAFLHQPLVHSVLAELGEQNPASLCDDLVSTVRSRLLDAPR